VHCSKIVFLVSVIFYNEGFMVGSTVVKRQHIFGAFRLFLRQAARGWQEITEVSRQRPFQSITKKQPWISAVPIIWTAASSTQSTCHQWLWKQRQPHGGLQCKVLHSVGENYYWMGWLQKKKCEAASGERRSCLSCPWAVCYFWTFLGMLFNNYKHHKRIFSNVIKTEVAYSAS